MRWVALALLATSATFAAEPEPPIKCNDAGTQVEMNVCAREAFAESDRKLNETYQALIRKEAGNKVFVAKLRAAQKAWIAFRDAEIEANFACEESDYRYCFGSMYGMSLNYFKKKLTDERQARLRELLERGREAS